MQATVPVPNAAVPNCCCTRKVNLYNVTAHYSANEKSVAHAGTSLLCGKDGKHTGNTLNL
jgi:hypothetical protein